MLAHQKHILHFSCFACSICQDTLLQTSNILTFSEESILLDLKHLLIEAGQKVPLFLATLQSENEKYLDIGGKQKSSNVFIVLVTIWRY